MSAMRLGYSTCPNDTFMFHALVHGIVAAGGATFEPVLEDIEALNTRAANDDRAPAFTKLSVATLPFVQERYGVIDAGAALGRGCGPLVVVPDEHGVNALADLAGKRVAIPGERTTAHLLLRIFGPPGMSVEVVRFDRIMPAVARGDFDAGLIIHESRFTYADFGLAEVADLGVLWESATGLPLPLGVIAARRDVDPEAIRAFETGLAASVRHAFAHPEASRGYVRAHAQELTDDVCQRHIELYVNHNSVSLGPEGRRAIEELLACGAAAGLVPAAGPYGWWA